MISNNPWHVYTVRLMALALVLMAAAGCGNGEPQSRVRPNVVLVLVDTFRADHAGCYGYSRPTTPVLDSLADAGTRYDSFQSQSSWTLPAMTTLFSGLTVKQHGAGKTGPEFYGVDTDIPYLPHMLQRRGYATAAFFNVVFMDADFGFHRGFDHFDCQGFANRMSLRRADETVDEAIGWIQGLPQDKPFLAAVHFYDPHISYNPPPPYDTLFTDPDYSGEYGPEWGEVEQLMAVNRGGDSIPDDGLRNLVALYDGELAFTDAQLGRLMAYLRRSGLCERTIVVVTADHGEEFLDHGGVEHGHTLYQELLAVPMVIAGPGVPAEEVVEETAAGIDLLPTLAVLLDLELPSECGGSDLLQPLPRDRAVPSSGTLWSEAKLAACLRDGRKVIWNADRDSAVVYDLRSDPNELDPLASDSSLVEAVLAYWSTPPAARPQPVDYEAAVDRTLRDLGYIR